MQKKPPAQHETRRPSSPARSTPAPAAAPAPAGASVGALLGAAVLGGLVARAMDGRPAAAAPINTDPAPEACERVRVVEVHHYHERPADDPDDNPHTGSQVEHECHDHDDDYGM